MLKLYGLSLEIFLIFYIFLNVQTLELSENDQKELIDFLEKTNSHTKFTRQDLLSAAAIDSNNDDGYNKRSDIWYNPRLGKRSKRSPESTNFIRDDFMPNDEINELQQKLNWDNLQSASWIIVLLAKKEKPVQYLTPRLGRDGSENSVDTQRSRPPFAPRLGKKSNIPFSPRLGRQLFEFIEK